MINASDPSKRFILALDQGTTSSRASVIDTQGHQYGMAQQEQRLSHPDNHYVEQDPAEIWYGQFTCAQLALERTGISPQQIACIGITNQRESIVLWDRATGMAIYPAIIWQDRRTQPICEQLHQDPLAPNIRNKTGLLIDPYFSATKIQWLMTNHPEARRLAQKNQLCIGTIDSWLLWHLTNGQEHKTDITNASRTMLFHIYDHTWDQELLDYFDIPRSCLPTVQHSSSFFGSTAERLFGCRIPITGIAGDQQSSLFGHGCHHPGQAKNTYGTGCFLLMCIGSTNQTQQATIQHAQEGLIITPTCTPHHYALEGSVFMGGNVFQWLKDQLHLINSFEEIHQLANSVPDTHGAFFVPAFHGLGTPYWDSDATGLFVGLKRTTTRAHLIRAAVEAIALRCAQVFDLMSQASGTTITSLCVDGKAVDNQLLMQLQADFLNVEVIVPKQIEMTILGAAQLAAIGIGLNMHTEDIPHVPAPKNVYSPKMQQDIVKEKKERWQEAIERARQWPYR